MCHSRDHYDRLAPNWRRPNHSSGSAAGDLAAARSSNAADLLSAGDQRAARPMALAADTYPAAATAGSSDAADLLSARDQRTTRAVAAAADPPAADATAGHLAAPGSSDA